MKSYATEKLRNVVLISHEGAGKTSLVEAALFDTGAIGRLGKVEEGTTVSDFEPDERERKISIGTAVVPVEWRDCKINFLDTPGYQDFIGELRGALRVADAALILVDATAGVEVGTEMAWSYAGEYDLPRLIFVNRLDREHTDFYATLQTIQADLADFPELYYHNYITDALKEFAEARLTMAFVHDEALPLPDELAVGYVAYYTGLAESVGELRRFTLDALRRDDEATAERLLAAMDDVYELLITIDYPDAVTGALRRATDAVRSILERTRGDLTAAAGQRRLERALAATWDKLSGSC